MLLDQVLDEFTRLRNCTGNHSLDEKNRLFQILLNKSGGVVLRLFDRKFKMKLAVAEETVRKIQKDRRSGLVLLSLEEFLLLNETIKSQTGTNSVSRKLQLLNEIYGRVSERHHGLLDRYYQTGEFRINFSEKLAYRCMIAMYPERAQEVKERRDRDFECRLYDLYLLCEKKLQSTDINTSIRPMLATLYDTNHFSTDRYYSEKKYDGFRVMVRKTQQKVQYWSRSGQPFDTENFLNVMTPVTVELQKINQNFLLDGQVWLKDVHYDCFRLLSPLIKTKKSTHINQKYFEKYGPKIRYVVFDVLELDNFSVVNRIYEDRRKLLERLCLNGNVVELVESMYTPTVEAAEAYFNRSVSEGFEGVILKDRTSGYESKRSSHWLKRKPVKDSLDVEIVSYEKGKGKYSNLYASFTVGVRDNSGRLVCIGHVGSGFTKQDLDTINGLINRNTKKIILQIVADSLTKSREYDSGYALRFPRMQRIRLDKTEPNDLETTFRLFNVGN